MKNEFDRQQPQISGIKKMDDIKTAEEVIRYFESRDLNGEQVFYLKSMSCRFYYLLSMVRDIRMKFKEKQIAILDIGPSFFTEILKVEFCHDVVYSLGFAHEESRGGHLPQSVNICPENFIDYDLNSCSDASAWPKMQEMQIVVFAEVIEHLPIAPQFVLRFINNFMAEKGYLFLQTPNAVALNKRIAMVKGYNPFEMIRENRDNPGHFREYTKDELINILIDTEFVVENAQYADYFPMGKKEKIIKKVLPASFKNGITIIAKKE